MMNKKGQVTIFVIVGIIIVISVFLVFYFLGDKLKKETKPEIVLEESSLEPMRKLVEDCVKKEVVKGIELVGLQGGYYDPVKYNQVGDYKISYDCHKDSTGILVNKLPTLARISEEIKEYTSNNMEAIKQCIDDFNYYKDQGYKIIHNTDNMDVDVSISDVILVDINYPVEVKKGNFQSSFNEINFQINSGLLNAYRVATDIVNDECTNVIFNIDNYVINNPPLAFIERQFVTNVGYYYYLETIPQRDEGVYRFHFLIER